MSRSEKFCTWGIAFIFLGVTVIALCVGNQRDEARKENAHLKAELVATRLAVDKATYEATTYHGSVVISTGTDMTARKITVIRVDSPDRPRREFVVYHDGTVADVHGIVGERGEWIEISRHVGDWGRLSDWNY